MQFKILSLLIILFLANPVLADDKIPDLQNNPQVQLLERNRNLRQQVKWLPSFILNLFLPVDDDALLIIHTDFHEITLSEFD